MSPETVISGAFILKWVILVLWNILLVLSCMWLWTHRCWILGHKPVEVEYTVRHLSDPITVTWCARCEEPKFPPTFTARCSDTASE